MRYGIIIFFLFFWSFIDARQSDYQPIHQAFYFINHKAKSKLLEIKLSLSIEDPSVNAQDIKIWLSKDNEHIQDILINSNHSEKSSNGDLVYLLDPPLLDNSDAEDVKININYEREQVPISLSISYRLPQESIQYSKLMYLLDDANALTDKMAGGMSWLVPSLDTIVFGFGKAATISWQEQGITKTLSTDDNNRIAIDDSSRLRKLDPLLVFSQSPNIMFPED